MNHPLKNTVNGLNKNRGREKPTNRAGKREQGMVKTTGNSGSGKILTIYSYMQSALFTYCGISQADITKMIGLYN